MLNKEESDDPREKMRGMGRPGGERGPRRGGKGASGAEVKTRWDKDLLVVQTAQERGPGFTETWRMTGDPAQIVVLLRLKPPNGEEVTLKRVYDRARAAE